MDEENRRSSSVHASNGSFFSSSQPIFNQRRRTRLFKARSRRGDSSIITTLILTSTVIAIGMVLLSYFSSVNAIRESDYLEQTVESVQKIQERFIIETVEVNYHAGIDDVVVWVYNYGPNSINITVTRVRVLRNGEEIGYFPSTELWTVESGKLASKTVTTTDLSPGDVISTEVLTSRGNRANDITKIQPKT